MSDIRLPASGTPHVIIRRKRTPPTPRRRLRVFALDPSIGKALDLLDVNQTVLAVSWEKLVPGPVGEYLEVIDIDPASGKAYEPVDLDDPHLLAQDGWTPSEGNPQFHQQMVYAVAMTTISHFERALGRKVLWAPDSNFKPTLRLRLYPHALRADNAYYSPEKRALLFGYFPARSGDGDATAPGSMVFTCLSSDVIAHEMTHALLDGLHRRFRVATNPDVPAFHEGFADIVALFQHYTMPELVRFEIARTQGDLTKDNLLGGLAKQFGEGVGRNKPLRNYAKADPSESNYATDLEPHDRGSILVYAVYDAFQRIVARRVADLIRIATGGSGKLPEGAIHPDLVERFTAETCKTAGHFLQICIRALDYMPPVDSTFGDYLRAMITADLDAAPDDRYGYRVAIIESFRKWRILPLDVRTFSEESLAWSAPGDPSPGWLEKALDGTSRQPKEGFGLDLTWDLDIEREALLKLNEENRMTIFWRLKNIFHADPTLYAEFGLLAGVPQYDETGKIKKPLAAPDSNFEVHSIRPVRRVTPDGEFRTEIVMVITQRRRVDFDPKDPSKGFFWFRGGATVIIDPRSGKRAIRYSVIKNIASDSRLERQRKNLSGEQTDAMRALFFGNLTRSTRIEEPFAMLHADHGDRDDGQETY